MVASKDIVHVRHPVPVRHVPKGGRHERLMFAQAVTPVRLREAAAGDFVPFARFGARPAQERALAADRDLCAFEGGIWTPLRKWQAIDPLVSPREFRTMLENWYVGAANGTDARVDFYRTPLHALGNLGPRPAMDPPLAGRVPRAAVLIDSRGEIVDSDDARLTEDRVERARSDLRRFLDHSVVVAGDRVFVRYPGPLAGFDAHRRGEFVALEFPRRDFYQFGAVARLDRLAEFEDFLRQLHPRWPSLAGAADRALSERQEGASIPWAAFPADLLADDDVDLFVQGVHERLLAMHEWLVGRLPEAERPDLHGHLDRLRHWRALGMVGSIRPVEAEQALLDAAGFVEAVVQALPHAEARNPGLGIMRRYIEAVALPRLRQTAPMHEADAETLVGLGM